MINRETANEMRRQHIMQIAIDHGIYTDHRSDGVCQQLLDEGWLERAEPIARRPHVSRDHAYLPTERAAEEWNK